MGKAKKIAKVVATTVSTVAGCGELQSWVCGKYSDGSPRSIPDAMNNEILSPRQKKQVLETGKKKKKKKNKTVKFKL